LLLNSSLTFLNPENLNTLVIIVLA